MSDGASTCFCCLPAARLREQYTYDAFGNPTLYGAGPDGVSGNADDVEIDASEFGHPYAYTGREWDAESGLYFYRARYMDPKTGRFLQEDPVESINLHAYTQNNPVNNIDPDGNLTVPFTNIWIPAGEGYGQYALSYWANKAVNDSNNVAQKAFYSTMGTLAALWTPCTSDKTATTLLTGWGIGRFLGRPYYQYYPAGNAAYSSRYLTRGWGWKAPHKLGQEAIENLSLPNYNTATAVRKVNVNPFRYLKGPSKVPGEFGQPGGGTQYIMQ